MKKRLLSLLLTLVLLLGLCPTTAQAKKFTDDPVNDEPYVFTDKDNAVLDNDVFARINAVTDSIQKPRAELTEQDYIDKLPEVIEAIKTSDTYVDGTLMQNGVVLIWETTVGIPCYFSPYLEAQINGAAKETPADDLPEALSDERSGIDGLPAQADPLGTKAGGNYPSSKEVGLIQPFWEDENHYKDSNFLKYSPKYKTLWEGLNEDTGGSAKYRYSMSNATVDNVAKTIEECGLVIIDSHGCTDYDDGKGDKTSKANCSYVCLITSTGITSEDYIKQKGPFGDYYHAVKTTSGIGVSGTCIANHMTKKAPHSYVHLALCLGMATDGICVPLRMKGVEAVFGYSQTVSFSGDWDFAEHLLGRLRDGGMLSDAVAYMKSCCGNWDGSAKTIEDAILVHDAFPIVASSEDAYPGHGNVDALQDVKSTWCAYQPGGRTFLVASDIEDLALNVKAALPGQSITVKAKVNGSLTYLPTSQLAVSWEASVDGVDWKKVNGADDRPYVSASEEMIGCRVRAVISPKNQDDHPFALATAPAMIATKVDNLFTPITPEITRGGSSPSSSVYLEARAGQEYVILTSSAEPTEADWENAWHYNSESTVTLSNTDKPVWNSLNYIWTRFYETESNYAGELKRCTKFYWGSASAEELQGTELDITFAYNQSMGDHGDGYWTGDVLKVDVMPIPEKASFDGYPGSTWYYPFLYDQSYGVFYSDVGCRYELDADTKYKTVYLKLKKPTSEAWLSCGTVSTKGCYTVFDVADNVGHFPVKKVTVPTYSIQIGEVTTGLPFSFTPDKATYNVEHLYVVRDTNVHENGPEGTEPTVVFHADGTMDVDTTPCIEAPYSFKIIEPDTGSVVGKMRVWVGSFDVVPLEGIAFDDFSVSCYAGKSVAITLRAYPSNGTGLVTWELSDESIATINAPAQIGANYTTAWVKISSDAKSGDVVKVTARSGDYSATCSVTVKAPPKVTSQPKDVTVKEGETAKFTVKATGDDLTYQWYYRAPGETGLTPVSAASGRTASYSLTAKAKHDGYRYSCWINGGEKITPEVTLTVLSKPAIKTQPTNTSVTLGAKATFTVEATGGNLSYQWYYRKNSSDSWTKVSAASGKTAAYSLTTQQKHDGYQYYCKVTNELGTAKTTTVTLKVKPKITTQPKNVSVVLGKTAEFTVAAEGAKSYQWYYRTSKTGEWKAVSAASGKTASYSLTTAAKHDGYQYRCKVKNTVGYAYTKTVTLKVKPKITTQPKDVTVKAGKTATFTVAAKGGTTYQWYYRTSETGEWKEVSAASGKTASYSLTAKAKHNGYQYRCKVTNKVGYVYTKTVTLKVN